MRNNGEACVAANRFHVAEVIADEFTAKLAARMRKLTLGRGTEDGVDMGPLIDERQRKTISSLVADSVDRGAEVVVGGHAPDRPGYFYEPTVLTGIPDDASLRDAELVGTGGADLYVLR